MNQQKTGKYIAEKRKLQNMTQAQLADWLGVSDKAVSKWERGISLPDVSKYQELCNVLEVSLNELFAGEDLNDSRVTEQSDHNLMEVLRLATSRKKQFLKAVTCVVVCVAVMIVAFIANLNLGEAENDNRLGQLKYSITTSDERYSHYTPDGEPMVGVTVDEEDNAHVSIKSYVDVESVTEIEVSEAAYASYELAVADDVSYRYRDSHDITTVSADGSDNSDSYGLNTNQLGEGVKRIICGILESGGAMAWIYTDSGTYIMSADSLQFDDEYCEEELHFFLSGVSVDPELEKELYDRWLI